MLFDDVKSTGEWIGTVSMDLEVSCGDGVNEGGEMNGVVLDNENVGVPSVVSNDDVGLG